MAEITMQDQINFLQRCILIHSYIYYHMNSNVISDFEYDDLAKRLVRLKEEYPDLWKTSEYYKQYGDDYNGSTGFHLYYKLNLDQQELIGIIASHILKDYGGNKKCM